MRGIPIGMSTEEIGEELMLQNLNANEKTDLKVIYIFPAKAGRSMTNCIVEVSSSIRSALVSNNKLYLRYSVQCRIMSGSGNVTGAWLSVI